LRQEVEKERQEAEEVKNQMAEAEALRVQLAAEAANQEQPEEEPVEEILTPTTPAVALYELVTVKGTRGNLIAKVKNTATNEISSVKVGDNLNGEVVTAITAEGVVVDRNGTEYFIKFSN